MLRLQEQDRSRWDRKLIMQGMRHLARSAGGDAITSYHLQAGIAACHCAAPDYESTDWPRILALYDTLVEIDDSPVIALNRAVATAEVHGPKAGMEALEEIPERSALNLYYLLHAVRAEFEARLGNIEAAANHLRKAIRLTDLESEQAFLERKLEKWQAEKPS